MFEHEHFDEYVYEDIPTNRDIYLMDEKWMAEYEASLIKVFQGHGADDKPVGFISYACARRILPGGIEFSWYPNIFDRFHEVSAWLPRDAIVGCVGAWQCDEKPHIFVNGEWLNQLHSRSYTVFALIDAIGVKNAISSNALTRQKLVRLRSWIDDLASCHTSISFISFVDSLLLKSNWTTGHYGSGVSYTYSPELFIRLFTELRAIYREELGLGIYAVLTQGSNEYYDDAVTHISASGNHISLNSLGVPFAQLLAIEDAAKQAIRSGAHRPCNLYMDKLFFHSVRFKFAFEKGQRPRHPYRSPMGRDDGHYFYEDVATILQNLNPEPPKPA